MDLRGKSTQTDSSGTCQKMDCEDGCETSETRSLLSVLEVADITGASEVCTNMACRETAKKIKHNINSLSAPKSLF